MNDKIRLFASMSHLDVYGLGKDRAKWEEVLQKYTELVVKDCALTAGLAELYQHKNIGGRILDSFSVGESEQ